MIPPSKNNLGTVVSRPGRALDGGISQRDIWWSFHIDNPGVYALFKRFALEMIANGVNKSSPWLIGNRIRWEVALKTVGSEYKVPNEHIAYYSRLFMCEHPQFGKFFNPKPIKGEDDTWWHSENEHGRAA